MTQIQSGFEATNLVFSYDGKPILKDINLKIKPGEFAESSRRADQAK